MDSGSEKKLLVIAETGIGDALTLLPALESLQVAYPSLSIFMLAPGVFSLRDNLQAMAEVLDHRELAKASLDEKRDWLRRQKIQWVWNTENEKSAWRKIFESENNPRWISAPPHRAWPRRSVLALRRQQLQQLFPEIPQIGIPKLSLTAEQKQTQQNFRSKFPQGQRLIAVQPTANDPTKMWPAEKFRALAQRLSEMPSTTVIFFLDARARKTFSDEFLPASEKLVIVDEPLPQAAAKLAACDLFVGNDSGFYHLAFALGLRVVGIYRSRRNARVWSYRSPHSRAVYFYLPSCIRKHWGRCLSVERVLRAAHSLQAGKNGETDQG
jgi:ADP-heptose:LPS heptosyltransferase